MFGNLTRKLENGDSFSLLRRILPAALLANERAGVFAYQLEIQKTFLGLTSQPRLVVRLQDPHHSWPEPSLEAQLIDSFENLSNRDVSVTIAAMVAKWLLTEANAHFQNAIAWIFDVLTERGWVRRQAEQRLNLFNLTSYFIPESTARLAQMYTESNGSNAMCSRERYLLQPESAVIREVEYALGTYKLSNR